MVSLTCSDWEHSPFIEKNVKHAIRTRSLSDIENRSYAAPVQAVKRFIPDMNRTSSKSGAYLRAVKESSLKISRDVHTINKIC